MKPTSLLACLLLGLSLILAGCSTAEKPDSIVVEVAGLKVVHTPAGETQVIMTLHFVSESLNPFGFSGSSHKLYLNGTRFGRAVSTAARGLPPLSTANQEVPLILQDPGLLRQLEAMQGDSAVKYRLESVLQTTRGEEDMTVKLTYDGLVDLRGLQNGSR